MPQIKGQISEFSLDAPLSIRVKKRKIMNASIPFSVPSGRIARLLLVPALLIAAVLSTTIRAASIGVDFNVTTPSHTLAPTDVAGVVPQSNWHTITTTSTTGLLLNDNTGAATTAALTYTAGSAGNWNNSAAGPDEWINDTWVVNFSPTITINVGSIPYASYDLIVYNLPLFAGAGYTYTVGSTSYYGLSPNSSPTSPGYVDGDGAYTYLQASSTNSGSPTPNSNYAVFSNLSGSSLTFSVTGANGIGYINAFQIIESVPEPSRAMLLLGSLLAIAGRRTRRRL